MLKIVICDDNEKDREILKMHINRFFLGKEDITIASYEKGYDLIQQINCNKENQADIIFLDITMPVMDGMRAAAHLRSAGVETPVVFVTNRENMVYQGYDVKAFAYLLKKHLEEKIEAVLTRYMSERQKNINPYFMVKKGKQIERIPLRFVKYLMSDKRKIRIIQDGTNAIEEFYMKMKDVQEELEGAGFIRCHQSYLVNISWIARLEGNMVVIQGGDRIPVSRRYQNEVVRRLVK